MEAKAGDPQRDCCCDRHHFTDAEVRVLVAITVMSSREAGIALRLSKRTIDNHVENMRKKALLPGRKELVLFALNQQIIEFVDGRPRATGRTCLPCPTDRSTENSPIEPGASATRANWSSRLVSREPSVVSSGSPTQASVPRWRRCRT